MVIEGTRCVIVYYLVSYCCFSIVCRLITSFGRTEADEERERQQRQQEEEEWARMPPEEQAQRQEMDELIRMHAGIPPWAGRRPYVRCVGVWVVGCCVCVCTYVCVGCVTSSRWWR